MSARLSQAGPAWLIGVFVVLGIIALIAVDAVWLVLVLSAVAAIVLWRDHRPLAYIALAVTVVIVLWTVAAVIAADAGKGVSENNPQQREVGPGN